MDPISKALFLAVMLAAAVSAGCSSNAEGSTTRADPSQPSESTASQPTPAEPKVFPGGKPLASYEGDATYGWRVVIMNQQDYIRREFRELPQDPALVPLDDSAFERIVSVLGTGNPQEQLRGRTGRASHVEPLRRESDPTRYNTRPVPAKRARGMPLSGYTS